MNGRYLLDTNILSEPLKLHPNPHLMNRLAREQALVVTAAPVWNELLSGCYRLPPSKKRQIVEGYLHQTLASTLPILPYDSGAAEWHASERARLTKAGLTPPFVDGQIAAVAVTNQLTLVTKNLSDFVNFQGLVAESWFSGGQ